MTGPWWGDPANRVLIYRLLWITVLAIAAFVLLILEVQ